MPLVRTLLAVVLLLALAGPSRGASLWGLDNSGLPGDTSYQDLTHEYRWELGANNLTVQYDLTFFNAFGAQGVTRVNLALDTWQNAVANAGRNGVNPAPATLFDLESVALHELGHVLGLEHPDQAPPLSGLDFDYDPAQNWPQLAAPGTAGYVAGAGQVMTHDIGRGVERRDLTGDDLAGMNFLYDPMNKNPDAAAILIAGSPISFVGRLIDIPPVDDALVGTLAGKNIDIFAADFTLGIPAEGCDPGSDEADCRKIFKGTDGTTLAYTVLRFKNTTIGTDGPGTILGADIYFNTNVNFFVPEPGTGLLLASGLVALAFGRRRRL